MQEYYIKSPPIDFVEREPLRVLVGYYRAVAIYKKKEGILLVKPKENFNKHGLEESLRSMGYRLEIKR